MVFLLSIRVDAAIREPWVFPILLRFQVLRMVPRLIVAMSKIPRQPAAAAGRQRLMGGRSHAAHPQHSSLSGGVLAGLHGIRCVFHFALVDSSKCERFREPYKVCVDNGGFTPDVAACDLLRKQA